MANRFDIDTGSTGIVTGLHYMAENGISKGATLILAHGAGAAESAHAALCSRDVQSRC